MRQRCNCKRRQTWEQHLRVNDGQSALDHAWSNEYEGIQLHHMAEQDPEILEIPFYK